MTMPLHNPQKRRLRDMKALDTHWAGTVFLLQHNSHISEDKKDHAKKKEPNFIF